MILTAPNLLIRCLETRKQEIFSHSCQDQPFKTLFTKSQAWLTSRVPLSGSLQPSTSPFAGELHHILLSQWECGKTLCRRESSEINFLSFFYKMPKAVMYFSLPTWISSFGSAAVAGNSTVANQQPQPRGRCLPPPPPWSLPEKCSTMGHWAPT